MSKKINDITEAEWDRMRKEYIAALWGDEIKEETSMVVNPAHYNKGIETWDYITSWKMGYLEGNIVKYVTRYPYKNGLEDLHKAREYLNKLIDTLESKNG